MRHGGGGEEGEGLSALGQILNVPPPPSALTRMYGQAEKKERYPWGQQYMGQVS